MSGGSGKGDGPFSSARRKSLFVEMAARAGGTTPPEVHRKAVELGDKVSEEAYYNIGRNLSHRGLVRREKIDGVMRFTASTVIESKWLEEEELLSMLDPDYPLPALAVASESSRQMREVPEEVWVELRERLKGEPARDLFFDSIKSYCEEFADQIEMIVELERIGSVEVSGKRQEAENTQRMLLQVVKYGLGISKEAVELAQNVDVAIAACKNGGKAAKVNVEKLKQELHRRVADECFVVEVPETTDKRTLVMTGVDGSSRGGMLSLVLENGDFVVGHAPQVTINTAVGVVHGSAAADDRTYPLFYRLPERPEDMQREPNRFTVMAKLLQPDMSDAKYMHSVWNAMDLVEARVALRMLRRWQNAKPSVEVRASDVVLRDGTVSPQDRDFSHYREDSTYGKIVRELIDANWEIAKKCRDDGQTVAGVVKNTELRVFGPVLNWYAAKLARDGAGQLEAWPMEHMNAIPDQVLLTRLLTAKRKRGDRWTRTCVTVRPFHALTNYGRWYSSTPGFTPIDRIAVDSQRAAKEDDQSDEESRNFWTLFRGENDPFVKMLANVSYGNFFVAAIPRLDGPNALPRVEFVFPGSNCEDEPMGWHDLAVHRDRLLLAIRKSGFGLGNDHTMFDDRAKLDVQPSLLIRAHEIVKLWATDLLSRVQEWVGAYLARYVKSKQMRGVKVRPYTAEELRLLYESLKEERDRRAGGSEPKALEA